MISSGRRYWYDEFDLLILCVGEALGMAIVVTSWIFDQDW